MQPLRSGGAQILAWSIVIVIYQLWLGMSDNMNGDACRNRLVQHTVRSARSGKDPSTSSHECLRAPSLRHLDCAAEGPTNLDAYPLLPVLLPIGCSILSCVIDWRSLCTAFVNLRDSISYTFATCAWAVSAKWPEALDLAMQMQGGKGGRGGGQ